MIAAVRGHCYGGGVQIALGADFRISAPDAQWSVMESKWGLIPDMSGIRSLAEVVGMDTAKLLTMTGDTITGERAQEIGLVTEVAARPDGGGRGAGGAAHHALPRRARRGQAALQRHLAPLARAAPSPGSASSSSRC